MTMKEKMEDYVPICLMASIRLKYGQTSLKKLQFEVTYSTKE